jgi:hypothetical protein
MKPLFILLITALTNLSQCLGKPVFCIVSHSPNILLESVYANQTICSGSYIWPSSSAPKYIPGFSVSIALMAGCVGTAFALMVLTKKYPYELTRDGGFEEGVQSGERGTIGEV